MFEKVCNLKRKIISINHCLKPCDLKCNYCQKEYSHLSMEHSKCNRLPVCDGTQNVEWYRYRYFIPVPNIFDNDTGTFFGTKFFRYRFRDFFPILNFTDTDSDTFFRYQIFPITPEIMKNSRYPLEMFWIPKFPKISSGTKFFRYRFRDFFPVPNFSDTGSETI